MTVAVLLALAGVGAAILLLLTRYWPTAWISRRLGAAFVGAAGAAWVLLVWSFLLEPEMLAVRQVTIDSPAWRGPPLRIGLISDTHAGAPHGRASRLRAVMRAMNAERPDIILLAGDYVGGHLFMRDRSPAERAGIAAGLAAFAELRAPLGVHAVLGNHDWWYDGPATAAMLRRAGVDVLQNGGVRLLRPGGSFWLAGVASVDRLAGRPDPAAALSGALPGEPALMLMHEPDSWPRTPDGLALSMAGHTHCGQVDLPFIGRPVLPSAGSYRWPCGLYSEGAQRLLYVTGGVGVSKIPIRFNQPPEIVIITLRGSRR